jgi:flagellar motor switch protein FliN/FliY
MTDQPESTGQDNVGKLLEELETSGSAGAEAAESRDQGMIDALLNEAQSALSGLDEPAAPLPAGVQPFEFKDLVGAAAANDPVGLDLLRDVQLDLKIELGRTHMHLEEVLRLKQGAVVTLDKLAGDPVDIYANGRLIARGEVLVLNDNFCVRVAELIAGNDGND